MLPNHAACSRRPLTPPTHAAHSRRQLPHLIGQRQRAQVAALGGLHIGLLGSTVELFIEVVDSYIRWYNEKRIKLSLGSLSPTEYRVSLGLAA